MAKITYAVSKMVKKIYLLALAAAIMLIPFSAMALEGDIRVHDPDIIKIGSAYYLFSTGIRPLPEEVAIEARVSYDQAITWEYLGDVFPTKPDWTLPYLDDKPAFWAPDIKYFNGKYHLYYSVSSSGSNYSAIGLATLDPDDAVPSDISSGWIDHGAEVVFSRGLPDDYNAIDPNLFFDDNGDGWLSYGSFWSGIKLEQIDTSTGLLINIDPPISIAARPDLDNIPTNNAIEAPYIVKKGDYYYLYVSFDYCCPSVKGIDNVDYKIVVGRATQVTGPYLDKNGIDMMNGGGTIVVKPDFLFAGKGHNAVHQEYGNDYLVYHAYPLPANDNQTSPQLVISLLAYDQNGWPAAGPIDGPGSGPFKIVNLNSGKCLEVVDSLLDDGANVQQSTCNESSNQHWSLQFFNGDYTLINVNSNKSLDAENCGYNIQQWTTHTLDFEFATCQQFKLSPTTGDYHEILHLDAGNGNKECLEVDESSSLDGANIVLGVCDGGSDQQWSLNPI